MYTYPEGSHECPRQKKPTRYKYKGYIHFTHSFSPRISPGPYLHNTQLSCLLELFRIEPLSRCWEQAQPCVPAADKRILD